jgi:hypothetical protein
MNINALVLAKLITDYPNLRIDEVYQDDEDIVYLRSRDEGKIIVNELDWVEIIVVNDDVTD